ncbi:MAG TPA: prepilin-type N-terminal cleavage/methylation domain-containing protein [Polyangia bacterium]
MRRRRPRGFTLIELMIAATLFSLIAAGAMSLVLSTSRAQQRSARIDVAQSGLRASFDFISRDVLSASAGAKSGVIQNGATLLSPIAVTDSSTAPDQLDLYLVDTSAMATVLTSVATGTTAITVDSGANFAVGDVVQVCDLSTAALGTVASASATTITLSTGITLPATVASYPPGSYLFRSRHVTYSIDSTTFGSSASANESMLMRDIHDGSGAQPLAEGIEDLQVALGFDNNGDGAITEVRAAANDDEWVYNFTGESAPVSLAGLKVVRVTVVTKSTQSEAGLTPLLPRREDRAAATTADGFPRRILQSEIVVRNFNL